MRILVVNNLLKWYLSSFFDVECVLATTEKAFLDTITKHPPDVLIFGDWANRFAPLEGEQIISSIEEHNIATWFYGGWGSYGEGGYNGAFMQQLLDINLKPGDFEHTIYRVEKNPNSFLKTDFADFPPCSGYHNVTLQSNTYDTQLFFRNNGVLRPVMLSRSSTTRNQLVTLAPILPGGAKRLVLSRSYISLLQDCLCWLTQSTMLPSQESQEKAGERLLTLLRDIWVNQVSTTRLRDELRREIKGYELEKLCLVRDIAEITENWAVADEAAEKLYELTSHVKTTSKTKRMREAEHHKLSAYGLLSVGAFTKASDHFEEAERAWKKVADSAPSDSNAVAFQMYFKGLSLYLRTIEHIANDRDLSKAKVLNGQAKDAFSISYEHRGHGLSVLFLELTSLSDIILKYRSALSNSFMSYIDSVYLLWNAKKIKNTIQESMYRMRIQNVGNYLTAGVIGEEVLTLLEKKRLQSLYNLGLVPYEQFKVLSFLVELTSRSLLLKLFAKGASIVSYPIIAVPLTIASILWPGPWALMLKIWSGLVGVVVILTWFIKPPKY